GSIEDNPRPPTVQQFKARKLFRDRDGGLWIGMVGGLAHVHNGRTDLFSASDGLSGDEVDALSEDREGNIWVTTINGLDRFREFAVPTFTVRQGLLNATVVSLLAARDRSVLLATFGGLNRWNGGQFEIYGKNSPAATQSRKILLSL